MAKEKSNKAVEEPKVEEVEEVEEVEAVLDVPERPREEGEKDTFPEPKVKQFKNNTGKGMKIKLVDGKNFKWITVKPGDIVTIPKKIAKANGLVKVQ